MNSRRLCLSASVLAIMATVAGSASAQTTVLTQGQYYDLNTATDTAVEVPTGMTAYLFKSDPAHWALPGGSTIVNYSNYLSSEGSATFNWWGGCCRFNAPVINVDSGATLYVVGRTTIPGSYVDKDGNTQRYGGDPWMQSMINATGAVVFEGSGSEAEIIGNNKFLGNVTLLDGAVVQMGWDWSSINFATTFGPNTHFDLQGASTLTLNPSGTGVFNGTIASSSAANFLLKSGTMVMNGQSTAFAGTVNIGQGGDSATLMIGNSTHSSAIFGATNKSATISVSNSTSTLSGYGTINGTVNNSGIVKPGGTSGVSGTLTINGNYIQSSTGQLTVGVTPTSSSELLVNGNATAAGSLVINIANGTYGNAIYPILAATHVSGSFGAVSTIGNVSGAIMGVLGTSTGYSVVTEKGSNAQVVGHQVNANRNALSNFVGSLYDDMAIAPESDGKLSVWLTPIGEIENLGRQGLGYEQTTYGMTLGAEHRFGWHDALVGGAFSYRHGEMSVKGDPATASSDGYDFAGYGGVNVNHVRIEGSVFYNVYDASTKRPMGSTGTSAADESGWAWGLSGQISRDLFGDLVTPYLRGTFARVNQNAATERGTTQYDLAYNVIHANTVEADAGIRVHVLRPQTERNIKLDVDLALRHDFSDPGETVTGGFASISGSPFIYSWKGDSQNALRGGLDIASQISDKLEVFGRLDGTFTLYRRAGEISGGVKYRF